MRASCNRKVTRGDEHNREKGWTHRDGRLRLVKLVARLQAEAALPVAPENGLERWKLAHAVQKVLPLIRSVGEQQGAFPHLESISPRHFQGQELGEPATQHDEPPDLLSGVLGWSDRHEKAE